MSWWVPEIENPTAIIWSNEHSCLSYLYHVKRWQLHDNCVEAECDGWYVDYYDDRYAVGMGGQLIEPFGYPYACDQMCASNLDDVLVGLPMSAYWTDFDECCMWISIDVHLARRCSSTMPVSTGSNPWSRMIEKVLRFLNLNVGTSAQEFIPWHIGCLDSWSFVMAIGDIVDHTLHRNTHNNSISNKW